MAADPAAAPAGGGARHRERRERDVAYLQDSRVVEVLDCAVHMMLEQKPELPIPFLCAKLVEVAKQRDVPTAAPAAAVPRPPPTAPTGRPGGAAPRGDTAAGDTAQLRTLTELPPEQAPGVAAALRTLLAAGLARLDNVEGALREVIASMPEGGAPTSAQLLCQGPLTVGSHGPLSQTAVEKARVELAELVTEHGIILPERAHMDNVPESNWRFKKKPDYVLANLFWVKGKTQNHAGGSLEQIVENVVKTWEMERSHKLDHLTHQSTDPARFRISANNGHRYNSAEANEVGNYNVLLAGARKGLWDVDKVTWMQSHDMFHGAFAAFPWELLEVFAGPPLIGFSWRHWGDFTGEYKNMDGQVFKGGGERIELFGFATALVDDRLRLIDVNVYYDDNAFLEAMEGKRDRASAAAMDKWLPPTTFIASSVSSTRPRDYAPPEAALRMAAQKAAQRPTDAQLLSQGPLTVGSHAPVAQEAVDAAREELNALVVKHGITLPVRAHMDGVEESNWRFKKKPDYTLANLLWAKGKTKNHSAGSLETIVENLVKTWEMERSHKLDPSLHGSLVPERFRISANSGHRYNNAEAHEAGNYNVLLAAARKELWDVDQITWQQSHDMFHGAFAAFPWELLEVFGGPPAVGFSWRHWGHFTGSYKSHDGVTHKGGGQLVELFGFGIGTVDDQLRLVDVKIYYDDNEFLEVMANQREPAPRPASAPDTRRTWLGGASPPLFARIGGDAAVEAAVSLFYKKVLLDDALAPLFEKVDMARLQAMQRKFLTQAFGGPSAYDGRELSAAHKGKGVTEAHFASVAGHLSATLLELGVPQAEHDEAMAIAASVKGSIVDV